MVTTCFSCQNLLSDFMDGILPASRHEEIKAHLDGCKACTHLQKDLLTTVKMMKGLPQKSFQHDLAMRIAEAAESRKSVLLSPQKVSRIALLVSLPILVLAALSFTFPNVLPFTSLFGGGREETQYARYFPLLQGAQEILEEQGNWLHSRDNPMGSLWEEGGLSPDEFEKTFQMKSTTKEESHK